jgi:hypothetical protein
MNIDIYGGAFHVQSNPQMTDASRVRQVMAFMCNELGVNGVCETDDTGEFYLSAGYDTECYTVKDIKSAYKAAKRCQS